MTQVRIPRDKLVRAAEIVSRVGFKQMIGKTKVRPLVYYRQALMAALRYHTQMSSVQIGDFMGHMDHTTVLHAARVCKTCPKRAALVAAIYEEATRL